MSSTEKRGGNIGKSRELCQRFVKSLNLRGCFLFLACVGECIARLSRGAQPNIGWRFLAWRCRLASDKTRRCNLTCRLGLGILSNVGNVA